MGDYCDGCDIMFEGMPPVEKINNTTHIAGDNEKGEKMEIDGEVFLKDGITAAENIVLYLYHTNADGIYAPADTQTLGKRNGRLRSWVKTNKEGKFKVHSIRPVHYPNSDIPAHIHIFVKEPGKTLYYIDEVWFNDDPLVTKAMRTSAEKRGGDMIITLTKNSDNIWRGNLKIILGRNIPGYE